MPLRMPLTTQAKLIPLQLDLFLTRIDGESDPKPVAVKPGTASILAVRCSHVVDFALPANVRFGGAQRVPHRGGDDGGNRAPLTKEFSNGLENTEDR